MHNKNYEHQHHIVFKQKNHYLINVHMLHPGSNTRTDIHTTVEPTTPDLCYTHMHTYTFEHKMGKGKEEKKTKTQLSNTHPHFHPLKC